MQVGIIGLPNSGKTTVFNALTGGTLPTTAVAASRLETHTAVVAVPDARVDVLSAMFKPRKTIYAQVNYVDIAGLEKGVGQGGLTGPFRGTLAQMDAFVHVLRAFVDEAVPHPDGSLDPQRDLETLDTEFLLADMVTVETRLQRLHEGLARGGSKDKTADQREIVIFDRLKAALEAGTPLRDLEIGAEEEKGLRGYGFLTRKPVLIAINAGEDVAAVPHLAYPHQRSMVTVLQGKIEMEIAQLPPAEAATFLEEYGIAEPTRQRVIRETYALLGLQSFFTVGEDEVRAWTIHVGDNAVSAAGEIHTDLAHGFIRAEVVSYQDLIDAGSLAAARTAAKLRLEGKEYVVLDGDILNIRHSS
jgi:GTP-binding protein YchF